MVEEIIWFTSSHPCKAQKTNDSEMLLFKLSKFVPGLKSQVSEMRSINLLLCLRELKQ
jgi:hypothetical protein